MGENEARKRGKEYQDEKKIFRLAPHRFVLQTRTVSFAQKRIVQKIKSSAHGTDIATEEPSNPECDPKDQQRP